MDDSAEEKKAKRSAQLVLLDQLALRVEDHLRALRCHFIQSTQSGKPRWLTPLSDAFLIHIVHDMTLQKLLKTLVLM